MENKIQREQNFHDTRYGGKDPRLAAGKFYFVKQHADEFFKKSITTKCEGKSLLEYGCAFGNTSADYINAGANLTGIDISPEGIKRAKQAAQENSFDANYLVMNAEQMTFDEESFELCVGSGILHHLDTDKSIKEIARILTTDGCAIFIEPMGHNPVINWYRNRTPSMRTVDEHPLLEKDIKLISQHFNKVDVNYFALTTLLAVPFRNKAVFKPLYQTLQKLDRLLFKIPFIGKNAWTVVLEMSEPIK